MNKALPSWALMVIPENNKKKRRRGVSLRVKVLQGIITAIDLKKCG
jgi:hypothetical protein